MAEAHHQHRLLRPPLNPHLRPLLRLQDAVRGMWNRAVRTPHGAQRHRSAVRDPALVHGSMMTHPYQRLNLGAALGIWTAAAEVMHGARFHKPAAKGTAMVYGLDKGVGCERRHMWYKMITVMQAVAEASKCCRVSRHIVANNTKRSDHGCNYFWTDPPCIDLRTLIRHCVFSK